MVGEAKSEREECILGEAGRVKMDDSDEDR